MAFVQGTAAGHEDLFDKFVDFLSSNTDLVAAGQEWQILRDETPPILGDTGDREVMFKAPGLSGSDEFFSSIAMFKSVGADYYNFRFRAAVGFLNTQPTSNQPGTSPVYYMHLWNDTIPYWFVANGRRAMLIAKISTTYHCAYMGGYLPYATPQQMPYPMFIGASSNQPTLRWSDNTPYHKSFWDPCEYSAGMYYQDGTWIQPANSGGDTGQRVSVNVGPYAAIGSTRNYATITRENVDGSYSLLPSHLSMASPINVFGELEGIYFISGHGNAAENIIQSGGVDHLVIQNIFRTNRWDYAAIKLA